jgi:hypothetical protein
VRLIWRYGDIPPSTRNRLADVVAGRDLMFAVRRLAADGLEVWAEVLARNYEGYVAKDEASTYDGGATRRWLEVKQKGWTVEGDGWQRRICAAPPAPSQLRIATARDDRDDVDQRRSCFSTERGIAERRRPAVLERVGEREGGLGVTVCDLVAAATEFDAQVRFQLTIRICSARRHAVRT